ncbi:hypothetical protein SGRIM128S_07544 [Streptomyces griseomycini]
MASTPSSTSRHRSSGEFTPPGKRQLMPTIAIGSSVTAVVVRMVVAAAGAPASSAPRCAASIAGVG